MVRLEVIVIFSKLFHIFQNFYSESILTFIIERVAISKCILDICPFLCALITTQVLLA